MKIKRETNELIFGGGNSFSEEFIIANNKFGVRGITISMAIACDEFGEGQFVSKNLTFEQFTALTNFCNEKMLEIQNSQK